MSRDRSRHSNRSGNEHSTHDIVYWYSCIERIFAIYFGSWEKENLFIFFRFREKCASSAESDTRVFVLNLYCRARFVLLRIERDRFKEPYISTSLFGKIIISCRTLVHLYYLLGALIRSLVSFFSFFSKTVKRGLQSRLPKKKKNPPFFSAINKIIDVKKKWFCQIHGLLRLALKCFQN